VSLGACGVPLTCESTPRDCVHPGMFAVRWGRFHHGISYFTSSSLQVVCVFIMLYVFSACFFCLSTICGKKDAYNTTVVPPVGLSTVAIRAFPVVDPRIWNDLPDNVTSAESLSTFRRRLKIHTFSKSFSGYFLPGH